MKSAYREFCRETVKDLKGDQLDSLSGYSLKYEARKLLRQDAKERKAARKRKKESRRSQR